MVQKSEKLAKSRKKSYSIDCFNMQNSFSGTPGTTQRGRCPFAVGLSLLISQSKNAVGYARPDEKKIFT